MPQLYIDAKHKKSIHKVHVQKINATLKRKNKRSEGNKLGLSAAKLRLEKISKLNFYDKLLTT